MKYSILNMKNAEIGKRVLDFAGIERECNESDAFTLI